LAVALAGLTALLLRPALRAADHADGPAASSDPAADITDVFDWMSADGRDMYLAMGIGRNVGSSFRFSDQVQYVFHTSSKQSFGAQTSVPYDIQCEFDGSGEIRCWAGADYFVGGDARNPNAVASSDRRLRVFAGLRDDSFFFNLTGFKETAAIVGQAAPSLAFDPAGCPQLNAATSAALVNQLRTQTGGAPARDDFARFNLGMIVVSIDKALVTRGGPVVGVWASTHRKS
jgi:hypothetical protein